MKIVFIDNPDSSDELKKSVKLYYHDITTNEAKLLADGFEVYKVTSAQQ